MTLDFIPEILVLSSESLFLFQEKYYVLQLNNSLMFLPAKKKKTTCETDILILLSTLSFSVQADSSSLETVFSRTL